MLEDVSKIQGVNAPIGRRLSQSSVYTADLQRSHHCVQDKKKKSQPPATFCISSHLTRWNVLFLRYGGKQIN